MPRKLYPGEQPPDWQRPDGSTPKSMTPLTKGLIVAGACVWGAIVITAVISNNVSDAPAPSSSDTPTEEATTRDNLERKMPSEGLPYVHDLPLEMPPITTEQTKSLSSNALELKSLWQELHRFRFDPKFHVLGFDPCCRYGEWVLISAEK